jgi:hypothetical protein
MTNNLSPMEHQPIRLTGCDGKQHSVWATSAKSAYDSGTKWGYRHGGLARVELLVLQPGDDSEGCWDRANAIEFGRQCDLRVVLAQAEAN